MPKGGDSYRSAALPWKSIRIPREPLPKGGLGDVVFQTLRQALREGLLRPGDRLREDEIAHHFQVSRTPVREALGRLQERRLVEPAGARGLTIRKLESSEIFELYAMREIMEGAASRLAAQNISPPEVNLLREIEEAFERPGQTPQDCARLNKLLHDTIAGAARNRYFADPLQSLQDAIALLGETTFSVADRPVRAGKEHRAIIKAIAERDADKAESAARDHIRGALATRMRMLGERL